MSELILMRHAKAVPIAHDGGDFERALVPQGRSAALRSASELAQGDTQGIRLLYSPALRTRETALIVGHGLALAPDAMTAEPELYAADPRTIRRVIQRHAKATRLLVVGHNPGISELGQQLSSALAHRQLATAEFWRLSFDAAEWRALMRDTAPR